jgi:hypothetical protein
MAESRRRMSDEARAELIEAVESDSIQDATEYAQAFATRHNLNPVTVRSAISRFRRERGMLKRPIRRSKPDRLRALVEADVSRMRVGLGVQAIDMMFNLGPMDPKLVRLAAAALVRFQADEEFRGTVEAEMPEMERIYVWLRDMSEGQPDLSRGEREAAFLRLLKLGG